MKYLIFSILIALSCPVYGQDFSIISSVTECKSVFPSIVLEGKKEELKPVPDPSIQVVKTPNIPSKSSPSWDLLGSMKNAYSKPKMVKHLYTHDNHSGQWTKEFLESLTIEQLWYLHDSDHEKKKSYPEPQKVTEPELCPDGL
jgi:hypothetical protein